MSAPRAGNASAGHAGSPPRPMRGSPFSIVERPKRASLAALGAMAAVALVFLAIGVRARRVESLRLATFVPTRAFVFSSDVEEGHASASAEDAPTYRPVIRYRYGVAGRGVFVSDRVTPLAESRSGRWAADLAARYRPGTAVTAYVDPADPTRAFLDRSRSILPSIFMAFGGGFLVLAGTGAALTLRR
ncbi:MAG TPA: DUF3592 domain-containing protein [Gemmatimonadaceae bacterium]|nr:DUF3592 domain-containing protein [Gemmatimonadaceae bacterium]